MKKTLLGDSFEQLGEIPKQVVKQTVKLPADIVKTALGQKPSGGAKIDPLTGIEIPSPQRVKQLKKQEAKRKAAAIPHAQQIIAGLQKPQKPQIPQYVAGKPGFSEEKVVKAHELEEKKKKELPPPVSASKPKMGTAEKKLGISG